MPTPHVPHQWPILDAQLRSRRSFTLGLCASAALGLSGCRRTPRLQVLGEVPEFHLRDQDDRDFSPSKLRGRVWVAAFMFSRCPTICPRITQEMQKLQLMAKARKLPVHLVSVSVDPENDTPALLRKYGEKYGADFASWSFVTGDYAVIRRASVDGFKFALEGKADAQQENFGILHGSHLVLVDGQSKIRGYYPTSDADAMKQLFTHIAQLADDD